MCPVAYGDSVKEKMYLIYFLGILLCLRMTIPGFVTAKIITTCKCGMDMSLDDRIIGGKFTSTDKYPWVAYIELNGINFCGGVLINNLYVITADHCINRIQNLDFIIYLHTNNRRTDKGIPYRPVEIIKFNNSFQDHSKRHDVALIKLDRKVSYDGTTVPICLPNPNSTYKHLTVFVLGWGIGNLRVPSDELKIAKLTVMSDNYCKRSAIGEYYNSDIMQCAYGKHGDACQGDSGGPLVYNPSVNAPPKYELIGTVSWGVLCGKEIPGAYSKITVYIDWISKNTQDADYCSY